MEIDSLEIKIQSDAEYANKKLDDLIKKIGLVEDGISAVGNSQGFKNLFSQAQNISKSMSSVGTDLKKTMQSVEPQMQKMSKNISEIAKDFQNKFKDTPVKVDFSRPEAELEKFKKQAQTAENALSRIMQSSSADKQVKSIEKWSISLAQAQNAVKLLEDHIGGLKSQMESISKQRATDGIKIDGERYIVNFKKELADTKATIEKFKNVYGSLANIPKGMLDRPIEGLTESLAELKSAYPQATNVIADFEKTLKELQGVSGSLTKERVVQKIDTNQFDKINEAKKDTQEFKNVLNSLRNIQPKINETNLTKLQNRLKYLEEHTAKLKYELKKGLRFGNISDKTIENLTIKIRESENEADAIRIKIEQIKNISGFERIKQSMAGIAAGISAAGRQANKAFASVHATLKKLNNGVNSLLSKARKLVKSMFSLGESAKKSSGGFNLNLKTILKYGFGIRSLFVLFNRLRNAIKEGMKNLVQYSAEVNASISMLTGSMNQLKNASAAMISPILNAFAPAIERIINLCVRAVNAINQLFSALTGKSVWIKATKQTADYAAGLGDANKAAEKLHTTTLEIDELNIIEDNKDAGGGGGAGGASADDMFETVPIESKFQELADKIKEIAEKIFEPLKKAWERQGQFVINSWKYALKEIGLLSKSIGEDFLEVWNQEKTVAMLENVLIIVGDIGLAVGNLASNFRIAWENNETGKRILENIRDIIAIIISNIKDAADATVEWAKNINFTPLLEAFEKVTQSLKPAIDAISGVLSDFYQNVLLPLGKWTIEKGLPDLLEVIQSFADKVDWGKLREELQEFWKHLEPFAETVGEGLILFIEKVSQAVAGFVNSEEFKNFLKSVEDWMDNVSAEDVANTIEDLATALIVLKGAVLGFSAISSVISTLTAIKNFLAFFGAGGEAAAVAGNITAISNALGLLGTTLAAMGTVSLLDEKFKKLGESLGLNDQQVNTLGERYDGIGGKINAVTDFFSLFQNKLDGFGFNASNTANQIGVLEDVMEKIGNGTIYTDEQLEKLQKRFGLTSDDVEMLRQSMLDANPELRNIADNFEGLGTASAATLDDIAGGMEVLSQTTGDYGSVLDMMTGSQSAMTEEAKNFFRELKTSSNMEEVAQNFNNATSSMDSFSQSTETTKEKVTGIGVAFEELKTKLSEKWDGMQTWFEENITPWFTAEKWYELWAGVQDGISLKWEEFKLWWSETALITWWEEYVAPWFSLEKWYELANGIKDGIQGKWTETEAQWIINITTWWNKNVSPWFTLKRWSDLLSTVPEAFKNAFKNAANGAISMLNKIIEAAESMANSVISALNSIRVDIPAWVPGLGGKSFSISLPKVSIPRIPQFKLGGFPEDGLFYKNSDEIITQVAGKTQVLNSTDTYDMIMRAAYEGQVQAQSELIEYLSQIAQNTRETAAKDLSVVIGDEDIAEANRRGEERLGFNFTPSYA